MGVYGKKTSAAKGRVRRAASSFPRQPLLAVLQVPQPPRAVSFPYRAALDIQPLVQGAHSRVREGREAPKHP